MFDCPKVQRKHHNKKVDKNKNVLLCLDILPYRYGDEEKCRVFLDPLRSAPKKQFNFRREAHKFVRKVVSEGQLKLNANDTTQARLYGKLPREYIVDFKIPPAAGGRYSSDNLYITTPEVSYLMYELCWRYIVMELNAFIQRQDQKSISVVMPKIPDVLNLYSFIRMLPKGERSAISEYLRRKENWKQRALNYIRVDRGRRHVVLKMKGALSLPKGMKKALVKASFLTDLERSRVRQEYVKTRPSLVAESLKRGDFDDFSVEVKQKIANTGHVPEETQLTCHHIIPRSIGGKNEIQNVCWLSTEDHIKLHKNYIDPLMMYFNSLIIEDRNVYFEIPVPENANLPLYVQTKKGTIVRESETKQKTIEKNRHFFIKVLQQS